MSLPALFISHGSPMLAVTRNDFTARWAGLGAEIGRPAAILVVSAHWETPSPQVTAAPRLPAIHDFHGFPEELYALRYEPPGDPALAGRVQRLLESAGENAGADAERGIDHGAWVPLRWMYPDADVAVVQLSLSLQGSTQRHRDLGRALAPLREEGVLVLASGGIVHNLRELDWAGRWPGPAAWAVAFNDWIAAAVADGDAGRLLDYRRLAPHADRAHPTPEHLMPFFVALGAGGFPARHHALGYDLGSLGMDCYAFGS